MIMANRHERRRAAVFTPKTVPISTIQGHLCAWRDCQESFRGDLPDGWVWLLTYWSRKADFENLLDRLLLDIALCPSHTQALQDALKEMPDARLLAPQPEA
jgi:hypothetical protein